MKSRDIPPKRKVLGITIGKDFAPPPTARRPRPRTAADEAAITRLTEAAHLYLDHGESALAFDSLMEAYIIDPLDARVLACEKAVLPAWEEFKRTGRRPAATPPATPAPSPLARPLEDEKSRLARLKSERESRRTAVERQMWERASGTSRLAPPGDTKNPKS